MKLEWYNIYTNWLTLRLERVESKNEIEIGGHEIIFRDIELMII